MGSSACQGPYPSHELDCDQNMVSCHIVWASYGPTPILPQWRENDQRGEPLWSPPEARGTEPGGSTVWVHHHPKAEVPEPEVRAAPDAIGTPHDPEGAVERPAP
jgi:hypothetical protein